VQPAMRCRSFMIAASRRLIDHVRW